MSTVFVAERSAEEEETVSVALALGSGVPSTSTVFTMVVPEVALTSAEIASVAVAFTAMFPTNHVPVVDA